MQFDHALWGEVVDDGSRFCHWGGKALSQKLAMKLELQSNDRVLDLCCGEGGLTDYLENAASVVGVDISAEAITQAKLNVRHSNTEFVVADVRKMPFSDKSFTKIVSQDADAWMSADKSSLMREIARVMVPSGMFLWQSYVTNEQCHEKTKHLLSRVGYFSNDMPQENGVEQMFRQNGFEVSKLESLHDIYAQDNLRMLERARALQFSVSEQRRMSMYALMQLLEWERELFARYLWSGVLVTAYRNPAI